MIADLPDKASRSITRALLIIGRLSKFIDFDATKQNWRASLLQMSSPRKKQSYMLDIALTDQSVIEVLYDLLCFFSTFKIETESNNSQLTRLTTTAMSALGHLCERHPRYILRKQSIEILNRCLNPTESTSLQLLGLQIMQDYLAADEIRTRQRQEAKLKNPNAKPELAALQGVSSDIAESGYASGLMQYYLGMILDIMQSDEQSLRERGYYIIHYVLKQGLVHPLQVSVFISSEELQ